MENKSQLKLIVIVGLVLASVFVGAVAVNESLSIPNESFLNKTEPKLAEFVNGKSIHTEYYGNVYSKYFNLSKTKFELIKNGSTVSTSLKIGNKIDWIKGFTINNENYAIHLVGCNRQKITCNFRVNGILVKDLSAGGIFYLNTNQSVKVKSITLDFCDNKFVCDYMFDSYDLVEIEILLNRK